MNPRISLITPVFNGESYLRRCLDSVVLAASGWPVELIIVDDGSTDGSAGIVRQYTERADWIRYVRQENQGPSGARNAGLDLATGDYIGFLDCDDSIHHDYFETLLKWADDADIIVFGYERIHAGGQARLVKPEHAIQDVDGEQLLSEVGVDRELFRFGWTKLFAARLVRNVRFDTKISLGEDTIFNMHAVAHANRFVRIGEVLYSYYETPGSLSSPTYRQSLLRNMESHFDARLALHASTRRGLDAAVKRDISKCYLGGILMWLLGNAMRLDPEAQLAEFARIRRSRLVETSLAWGRPGPAQSLGLVLIQLAFRLEWFRVLRWLLSRAIKRSLLRSGEQR